MRELSELGKNSSLDYPFLKEQYPGLKRASVSLKAGSPYEAYPQKQYRLLDVFQVPGGYLIAHVHEYKLSGFQEPISGLLHEPVYGKNASGEYTLLAICSQPLVRGV